MIGKSTSLTTWLLVGLGGLSLIRLSARAQAESPYERDQRAQLEKYQREHGVSPQAAQAQRWEQEWRQQHPHEPMPSFGALEKLHRQETLTNIDQGFAAMRQRRQAELKRNYMMARQHQQQVLESQHITWSAQQWRAWDRQYDLEQQQRAQDYLKAVQQAGEIARLERERDEEERLRKQSE